MLALLGRHDKGETARAWLSWWSRKGSRRAGHLDSRDSVVRHAQPMMVMLALPATVQFGIGRARITLYVTFVTNLSSSSVSVP